MRDLPVNGISFFRTHNKITLRRKLIFLNGNRIANPYFIKVFLNIVNNDDV